MQDEGSNTRAHSQTQAHLMCFLDGAIREPRALIARGLNKNALGKAWTKHACTRAKDCGLPTKRFKTWVDEQDFSAAAKSDPEKEQAVMQTRTQKNTSDLLCGLKALNAILSHVKKDMVDRSVTDSAAIDMAKREEQLLNDKSVSKISDFYHTCWMFL